MPTTGPLSSKHCVPCEGGAEPLSDERSQELLTSAEGWAIRDKKLEKRFTFPDFVGTMRFLNKVAELAEAEGHHPDFCVHYDKVDFTLWTHALGGLSENDFILAAKLDCLPR